MRKRPNAKRNIILFVSALALIVGLIVVVGMTRHTVMIMPPESPEVAAKRQAPDNAYLILEQAEHNLPAPPANLPQLAPGLTGPGKLESGRRGGARVFGGAAASFAPPNPDTMSGWFDTNRPDDDPEMIAYVQQCQPVVAAIQAALAKPYCLPPVDWAGFAEMPWNLYVGPPAFVARLGNTAIGEGVFAFRVSKDPSKGTEAILTAARLGATVQHDGPISFYERGGSLQQQALQALDMFIPALSDDGIGSLIKDLDALRRDIPSPSGILEFQWRVIDNIMRLKMDERFEGGPEDREFAMQFMFNTQMKSLRQLVVTYKGDFAEAVVLPYPEFVKWKMAHPVVTQRGGRFGATDPVNLVNRLVIWRTLLDTFYGGAELALALERHRRSHTRYPDSLDALAPEPLASLPVDPFTGKPFLYRVDGDGYWLYSAGINQVDDGGKVQTADDFAMTLWSGGTGFRRSGRGNDTDIVVHRPAPPAPAPTAAPAKL
jgi:hypothetical protein